MPFDYEIDIDDSSLIKFVGYNVDEMELTVRFKKYYVEELVYINVPTKFFIAFTEVISKGKYYLEIIKPNFKLKSQSMANKPTRINKSSDKTRFIKMSIDVTKIDKEWLYPGKDGAIYLNCTLMMKPDGQVDKYGNLGMIVQDVPKEIIDEEKNVPKNDKTQGEILGNGAELEWGEPAVLPGSDMGKAGIDDDTMDDLPF